MMNELLRDIYLKTKPPSTNERKETPIRTEMDVGITSDEVGKIDGINTVALAEIDPAKSLTQTQSLLEFYLVGLSRNLKIKPK
jgi:hypothetical protein